MLRDVAVDGAGETWSVGESERQRDNKDKVDGGSAKGLSYETAVVETTLPFGFASIALGEGVPEPKRLVSSPSHYRLPVRTHGEIQHSMGMPRQRSDHI